MFLNIWIPSYEYNAHFQAALKVVQPSAKREGFATVPGVSWADVGALTNIRKTILSFKISLFSLMV